MASPVTTADLQQMVADDLHKGDKAALKSRWIAICTRSVERGWRDLKNRLLVRGYTDAQIEAWDDKVSFTQDQSLFWAFVEGSGLADYSDRDYNKLDHRKEVEDAKFLLVIGGIPVVPGQTDAGYGAVIGGIMTLSEGEVSEYSTFRTQKDRRERWYGCADETCE